MIGKSFLLALVPIAFGACSSHHTPATDAEVAAAEARAERSDVYQDCLKEVDKRYNDAISDCRDATCKAAVEKQKVSWYDACK